MLKKASLYFHTVKHLKFRQIFYRLYYKFKQSKPARLNPPKICPFPEGPFFFLEKPVSYFGNRRFRFLNTDYVLKDWKDWDSNSCEKLWIYNLHYFDYIHSTPSNSSISEYKDIISHWINNNPPYIGVGWAPYPVSLRVVNWIKFSLKNAYKPFLFLENLALQGRCLYQNIEWHILGNHLFENGKALIFLGVFFQGKEADKWLKKGIHILKRELKEQILEDGGHFELSPMYHSIILEGMLDLYHLSELYTQKIPDSFRISLKNKIDKMLTWLEDMSHPDGGIAFFNDAAMGIAPSLKQLQQYAKKLELQFHPNPETPKNNIKHLKTSGYIVVSGTNHKAILDVGNIGPDYLPGHAHADTLSFELSLYNKRFIVNGGTSCYGTGKTRQEERSTASHSAVEVNGQNSSEVWGGFRVAKRAYPKGLTLQKHTEEIQVKCAHDGYKRLKNSITHTRTWAFTQTTLKIQDNLSLKEAPAISRFILHPDVKIKEHQGKEIVLECAGKFVFITSSLIPIQIEEAFYAPEFGVRMSTKALAQNLTHGQSNIEIKWS